MIDTLTELVAKATDNPTERLILALMVEREVMSRHQCHQTKTESVACTTRTTYSAYEDPI